MNIIKLVAEGKSEGMGCGGREPSKLWGLDPTVHRRPGGPRGGGPAAVVRSDQAFAPLALSLQLDLCTGVPMGQFSPCVF